MDIRTPLEKLPALGSTDGEPVADAPAVKVFMADGAAFWVLWEASDDMAFGYCDLGFGMGEIGYVSISELESARGAFGLEPEVDRAVKTVRQGYKSRQVTVPDFLEGGE